MMQAAGQGNRWVDRIWNSATAWWWLALLTRGLSLALVLPLVLRGFASETVTLWLVFGGMVVVLALCDFGFNATLTRLVAYSADTEGKPGPSSDEQRSEPDSRQLARLVGTTVPLFLLLGLLSLLLGASAGSWYLGPLIAATPDPADSWLAWVLLLLCSSTLIAGTGFSVLLNGMHQVVVVKRWEAACTLASALSGAALLFSGTHSLAALIASTQVWGVIYMSILGFRVRRNILTRLARITWQIDRVLLRSAWPAAWRTQLGMAAGLGTLQLAGLAYVRLAGSAEAAPFLLAFQLMLALLQLSVPPFYSRLPKLATLYAKKEHQELVDFAAAGMASSCWTFVAGLTAGGLLLPVLLDLAGSRTSFVSQLQWATLGLGFYAERVGSMHLQMCALTNRINWHVASSVTAAIFAGAMSLFAARTLDYAIPLSMLVAHGGFLVAYSIVQTREYLKIDVLRFERRTCIGPLLALLAYLAVTAAWR